MKGGLNGLYPCRNKIVIMLFAFTMFSFLPNRMLTGKVLPVDLLYCCRCIPANKLLITSCFSHTFTVFYSPTWNAQSSKFWQQTLLSVSLVLADD